MSRYQARLARDWLHRIGAALLFITLLSLASGLAGSITGR